jgi:hypothetical protein
LPPRSSFWIEKVRVYSLIWPHISNKVFVIIPNFDKYILANTFIVSGVVLIWSECNSNVNNWHELNSFKMNLVNDGREVSKVNRVISKISVGIHVVNVHPLDIKRKIIVVVVLDIFKKLFSSLVSPFAVTPSKSPLRHKDRSTSQLVVLSDNIFRTLVVNENEKISNTSNCN